MSIDAKTATFQVSAHGGKLSESYLNCGLDEFKKAGRGTLMLSGAGMENEKKVDVRITIRVARNMYTYQKETRAPGGEFLFRDGYTFTRREVPVMPVAK
ncbi:MAG: hypothetical protein WCE52_21660 [Candidatus Acidiferrum sp.]